MLRLSVAIFMHIATLTFMVQADTLSYGSFKHDRSLPGVLFLTGQIQANDSFELRRAMRDQTIDLVVTASPGGNLYEGLQIAAILHDNQIATYLPETAQCESSCANVFLGGYGRLAVGNLGVHQFFSSGPAAADVAPKNQTTATTQYTTADIIGIMNQFDTPPFVYEKMFATADIYYFSAAEKARLNKGIDAPTFTVRVAEVDAFLLRAPASLDRPFASPAPDAATLAPAAGGTSPTPAPATLEDAALALLLAFNQDWSMANPQALARMASYYAGSVEFYGKQLSHAEVMAEKETFAKRWPKRAYDVMPGTVSVYCSSDGCLVDAIISWTAASDERGKKASGQSTWTLILAPSPTGLKIAGETGKTVKRQ